MGKEYCRSRLIGAANDEIIAEWWGRTSSFLDDKLHYFYIGKDLVTGVPVIFDCKNEFRNFESEVKRYGRARLTRLGAEYIQYMSMNDALKFLKNMSEEDIKKYKEMIDAHKAQHRNLVKEYKDNKDNKNILKRALKSEKNRVRSISRD